MRCCSVLFWSCKASISAWLAELAMCSRSHNAPTATKAAETIQASASTEPSRQRRDGSCERTTSSGGGGTYTIGNARSGAARSAPAAGRMRLIASPRRQRQASARRSVDCAAVILKVFPAVLLRLMLWLKALHIVFVVTWFAGLFYLPRLYIYDVESDQPPVRAQLQIMQRRLLMITHVGAALALVF